MRAVLIPIMLAATTACTQTSDTTDTGRYGFQLSLTFSPAAKAKLTAAGEQVKVVAIYRGEASAPGVTEGWQDGVIGLGSHVIIVSPSDQIVSIPGIAPKSDAPSSIRGQPEVLINAWSARMKDKESQLDCTVFEGLVSQAQVTSPNMHCMLRNEVQSGH